MEGQVFLERNSMCQSSEEGKSYSLSWKGKSCVDGVENRVLFRNGMQSDGARLGE